MKQGDAGVHCGQHPTKTPQCSCDMKKGRFLHVPVFDNGKRLSQEPHTCSREVTRFYEKFFDVSRSFGVSSSSLKFREVSVFREVMKMPTIFYFHDGPYIISMTSSIRHDVDQIILRRPFSCRMTTPPIPTRPR